MFDKMFNSKHPGPQNLTKKLDIPDCPYFLFFIYFEGFTSIPTALTANDRNRRIQVYQASDG